MHLRPMGINADLDRLHPDFSQPRRFRLANHDGVRLELYTKLPFQAGILEDLEEVLSQENFATAEGKNKNPGVRQLIQQMLDLGGGHLATVVVLEVTMHTTFIAAISKIELHAERDVQRQRLFVQFSKQAHHFSPKGGWRVVIGVSESSRISQPANSRARACASARASVAATSNSVQILFSTISSSGVDPSAHCQRIVAVLFSVNNVESVLDMIIISPSRLRAAARGLRAI